MSLSCATYCWLLRCSFLSYPSSVKWCPFRRDGLERIEVDAGGTIGTLRQQISSDLNMPRENVTLSKDQKLVCIRVFGLGSLHWELTHCTCGAQLVSKTPEHFKDLSNNKVRLKPAGVQHGDIVSRSASQNTGYIKFGVSQGHLCVCRYTCTTLLHAK